MTANTSCCPCIAARLCAGGSSADGGPSAAEGSTTPKSGAPAAAAAGGEAGGGDALSRKRAYKEKWQEGVALFNKKPKKGIAMLQVGRHTGRGGHRPSRAWWTQAPFIGVGSSHMPEVCLCL